MLPTSCGSIELLGYPGHRFVPWLEGEDLNAASTQYEVLIDADPGQYSLPFHDDTDGTHVVRLFAHYRADAVQTTAYERMAEGLAKIGPDAVNDIPTLRTTPSIRKAAAQKISQLAIDSARPTIVVHPGSSGTYSHKRWMSDRFAETINELHLRTCANMVLVGSGWESGLLDSLCGSVKSPNCVRVALDWTLCELARLLDRAALFIGNDSGVGHLAAALGRPVVTVAGPTYPQFWAPMTDRALVTDPRGCCYRPDQCGVVCMKSISSTAVIGAAEALLHVSADNMTRASLDSIKVANDIDITKTGPDSMIMCSRRTNCPLSIERGSDFVLNFLKCVELSGSAKQVQSAVKDADVLLEQCFRNGIVLHATQKEELNEYVGRT
jgi:hypothetical protein